MFSLFGGSGGGGHGTPAYTRGGGESKHGSIRDRSSRGTGLGGSGSGGGMVYGGSAGVNAGVSSGSGAGGGFLSALFRRSSSSTKDHHPQRSTSTAIANNSRNQQPKASSSYSSLDSLSTVKDSRKLTKQPKANQTTTTLNRSYLGGIGGYSYPKLGAEHYDEQSNLRRQAFPSLLANNPVLPKPAGYLYAIRSALSSRHSMSQVTALPSTTLQAEKHHTTRKQSKHQRPSSPPTTTRKASTSHRHKHTTTSAMPVQDHTDEPRASRRALADPDGHKKSKSKSKHHHKHRTPEEKERRKRAKAEETRATSPNLVDLKKRPSSYLDPPTRKAPSPPPLDFGLRTTSPIAGVDSSSGHKGGVLQARTDGYREGQGTSITRSISQPLPSRSRSKTAATRVSIEQTNDAIRLHLTPAQHTDVVDLIDDSLTDSDGSSVKTPVDERPPPVGAHLTKSVESEGPHIRILDDDDGNESFEESIDFLLPYGGLPEKFDSGYEIEQDVDDEEYLTESEQSHDRKESNSGTLSYLDEDPGFTDTRRMSRHSKSGFQAIPPDPLTQQMPLLLSLVENTISAYETILTTKGSFAVGISGYKSVARLLLDRVGDLFTRKLGPDAASWGEVLEWVGGRRAKPALPKQETLKKDNLPTLFNGSTEKLFIYSACLEEPDVLDPAAKGLGRLFTEDSITAEITAAYLTLYPQLRPLLQALAEMTPEELDLLKSKRLCSFLDVEDGIKSDEEREIKECEQIEDGIAKSLVEFDVVFKRLKSIKSKVQRRRQGIIDKVSRISSKESDDSVPSEVKLAVADIKHHQSQVPSIVTPSEVQPSYESDHDDTDTLIPDDSASQFNPYVPRRVFSKAPIGTSEVGATINRQKLLEQHSMSLIGSVLPEHRPNSPSPSVYTTLTSNTNVTSRRKKKHATVKIALSDKVVPEDKSLSKKGPIARLAEEVLGLRRSVSRMSRVREDEQEPSSLSRTQSKRSVKNISLEERSTSPYIREDTPSRARRSSKTRSTPVKDRSSTPITIGRGTPPPPLLVHGVGGYSSNTPIAMTTETINLKKEKREKEKRRNSDSERKKKRSSREKDKMKI